MKKTIFALMFMCFSMFTFANTVTVGFEDSSTQTTIEKNGDYNDAIISMNNVFVNTESGVWKDLTVSTPNESGTPFWSNPSLDGPDMNVGYCLTTSNCGLTPQTNLEYLATPSGGMVHDVLFSNPSDSAVTVTFLTGIAANLSDNVIGFYNPENPFGSMTPIFNGTTSPTTVTFDPGKEFGLYFIGVDGNTSFSQSMSTWSHDAIFSTTSDVPEPGTFSLFGIGLIGFGLCKMRRKQSV